MNDEQFWRLIGSAAYRRRFRAEHPFIEDNGGVAFYNSAAIRQRIACTLEHLERARDPKNHWLLTNRLNTQRSWLRQAEWIEARTPFEVTSTPDADEMGATGNPTPIERLE